MKRKVIGIVVGGLLFTGGGTVVADQQINPYTDKGTTLEIASTSTLPEGGEQTIIADKTEPKITLQKWNGEVALGVRYTGLNATGDRPFLSKNVEWSDGTQKMEAVPLEDGGMEINIILNSPPTSNVFNFAIDGADNLDFFYQSPLTDQDIKEGVSRPDNVVGSYAVYYKDHANHIEGQTNYATGKAYHIFRPLVTDANSATTWADLSYENGVLSVTVPQKFLDAALYPVKVDPTFGNINIGATKLSAPTGGTANLVKASPASSGTVTSISSYISDCFGFNSGDDVKIVIWDVGTLAIISNGTGPAVDASTVSCTTGAWDVGTYASSPSVTSGTNYYVGYVVQSSGTIDSWYDTGASATGGEDTTNNFTTPIAIGGGDITNDTRNYSVYATYTASTVNAPVVQLKRGNVTIRPAAPITTVFTSSGTWTAPLGITSVEVRAWGDGGGSGSGLTGPGGGGGAFTDATNIAVTPGNSYIVTVGQGQTRGVDGIGSSFISSTTVFAEGGKQGLGTTGGIAGAAANCFPSTGATCFSGGNGGDTTGNNGGGGGGGGGTTGNGGTASGQTPGTGTSVGGGTGGAGANSGVPANPGAANGGGMGGQGRLASFATTGGRGEVDIIYSLPTTVLIK